MTEEVAAPPSASGVVVTAQVKQQKALRLYGRLFREFIRPHIVRSLLSLLCMAVVAAATTANAWMMQPVLDRIFVSKASTGMLWLVAGAVLALAMVKGVATYFQQILMTSLGQRVVTDIQKRLFDRVIRADLAYFQATPSGELISRFMNDTGSLRFAATQVLTGTGRDALSVVGLTGMMFYQDWTLAIAAMIVIPGIVGPLRQMGKRLRKVAFGLQSQLAVMTTLLSQVFQGARHVKAYGMEEHEAQRFSFAAEKVYQIINKSTRIRAASSPLTETLGGAAIAGVILFGGWQVMHGVRTPGAFFSFISSFLLAYAPMKNLASLNINIQEGMVAAQRLFSIIDLQPAIREAATARNLDIGAGAVRFEKVTFAYGGLEPVLRDFDLDVPGGQKVALVGPSGGGKSTILNLIPRFYDVSAGRITIDGMDIRDVTFDSLRRSIALVSQEISLFDDTIRANIAYGRMTASEDEIVEAARSASAHDFIMALPAGYDTLVGEHGIRLSGGQRQRVSIARAMLKDAPILLLDEATSALDTESERAVQAALARLMTGRTTLVIAHRLSTVQDADLIYAVQEGKVMEVGRHQELLTRPDSVYARLWRLQFEAEPHDAVPGPAVLT